MVGRCGKSQSMRAEQCPWLEWETDSGAALVVTSEPVLRKVYQHRNPHYLVHYVVQADRGSFSVVRA